MDDLFHLPVSEEKMAAFLDGNFSADEMSQMSAIINDNELLHQMVVSSDVIDQEMEDYMSQDSELPEDLSDPDLAIPEVEESPWHHFGKVGMVAAAMAPPHYDLMDQIKEMFQKLGEEEKSDDK